MEDDRFKAEQQQVRDLLAVTGGWPWQLAAEGRIWLLAWLLAGLMAVGRIWLLAWLLAGLLVVGRIWLWLLLLPMPRGSAPLKWQAHWAIKGVP